jgi:ADP-ribosylglycohydrolase
MIRAMSPADPQDAAGSPSTRRRMTEHLRLEGRRHPELSAGLVVARGETGLRIHEFAASIGCSPEALMALERGALAPSAAPREVKLLLQSAASVGSRVRGCLLAGAVGDALGAGVEFLALDEIRRRFGPDGISGYVPAYGRLGAITDDTQMTLFTAEGLLAGGTPQDVSDSYRRWLRVQDGGLAGGWLAEQEFLHHSRAPGNTCVSAVASGVIGTVAAPINDSKGCGGVMRAAPCGIVATDVSSAFGSGVEAAAITHGHPSGYLAAGVLAAMVHGVVSGVAIDASIESARAELRRWAGHDEVLVAVDRAMERARGCTSPTPDDIAALGAGWVAEEALAIAVFCAVVTVDVRSGLLLAANHSGDSDSTAAIAGNLLGAALGEDAIPGEWLDDLEGRAAIETISDRLASLRP